MLLFFILVKFRNEMKWVMLSEKKQDQRSKKITPSDQ